MFVAFATQQKKRDSEYIPESHFLPISATLPYPFSSFRQGHITGEITLQYIILADQRLLVLSIELLLQIFCSDGIWGLCHLFGCAGGYHFAPFASTIGA